MIRTVPNPAAAVNKVGKKNTVDDENIRIRRSNPPKEFTLIGNETLRNKGLSYGSSGIHAALLSFPNDWKFRLSHLSTLKSKNKECSTRSKIKPLVENKFIQILRVRDEHHRFAETIWLVSEFPSASHASIKEHTSKSAKPAPEIRVKRAVHTKNFTKVPNFCLIDSRIGWTPTGLLIHILSLPQDWKLSLKQLVEERCDGRDKVRKAVAELKRCGYLMILKLRNKKGQFTETQWFVSDSPFFEPEAEEEEEEDEDEEVAPPPAVSAAAPAKVVAAPPPPPPAPPQQQKRFTSRPSGIITWTQQDIDFAKKLEAKYGVDVIKKVVDAMVIVPLPSRVAAALSHAAADNARAAADNARAKAAAAPPPALSPATTAAGASFITRAIGGRLPGSRAFPNLN